MMLPSVATLRSAPRSLALAAIAALRSAPRSLALAAMLTKGGSS
jgi:hypothetical protein